MSTSNDSGGVGSSLLSFRWMMDDALGSSNMDVFPS